MTKKIPSGYDIRPWQPGDEVAILALFKASFGRELSPAFWRWRFQDHPLGDPLVMLAWQGDRLAAHYGASQAPMHVDGNVIKSALSMTTMTHPNDRGLGLVEAVGEALYAKLEAQGYAAAWGFPNAMINATRQRKLSWTPVCDLATLSVAPDRARHVTADPGLQVMQVAQIDQRFGDLTADVAASDTIQGSRDTRVLKWRVDANPLNQYTRWVIENGAALTGYAITKTYADTAIDIVDLCAVDGDHVTALGATILDHARKASMAQINTWALPCDPNRVALERLGFAATAPVTYLGGRSFGNTLGDFTDSRRWRVSMLESDLY